ncbi:MAG: hypothetical protein GX663_04145 [Clostridiales bacterium]|nr:hypothetical protein [Clostridiales bacterium]
MENKETFAKEFFKLYDRKITSGEISFSQIGMSKEDFNRLCIVEGFVPEREKLVTICEKMKLTEEETKRLLAFGEGL